MELRGERIFLRALEPDDADTIYKWENDTTFWKVSNTLTPFSLQAVKDFINGIQDIYTTKQLRLMICKAEDETPIGTIDLFDFDPFHQRAGLGILIAESADRKKHYASEALDLLCNYAFNLLQLHQIYCNIAHTNVASIALFQKAGFSICGTKKEWIRDGYSWADELMLQRLNNGNQS
jgi:diamine N-acetyltransferase